VSCNATPFRPRRERKPGDLEVDDPSAVVAKNNQSVEKPECRGGDDEHARALCLTCLTLSHPLCLTETFRVGARGGQCVALRAVFGARVVARAIVPVFTTAAKL
jgi:hypothetical protein